MALRSILIHWRAVALTLAGIAVLALVVVLATSGDGPSQDKGESAPPAAAAATTDDQGAEPEAAQPGNEAPDPQGSEPDNAEAGGAGPEAAESPATPLAEAPAAKQAQASNGVRLELVGKFRSPLHVAQPPGEDGLLVVAEKQGRMIAVRDGKVLKRPFLDIHKRARHLGTEQGLLSVAFAPDYQRSRHVYVSYTAGEAGNLRIEEYKVRAGEPNRAVPSSRRKVLVIPQPNPIHNGGLLMFGPDDKLYIGAGDGGPSHDPFRRPQNLKLLFGKLLRIDPQERGKRPYTIPKTNPFQGSKRGLGEIYASGLRNPWRFSFDRKTGLLTLGDVGQDFWEEVNVLSRRKARGANFGWSGFEGTEVFNRNQRKRGTVKPALVYRHGDRGCAVTGGYVLRDPNLPKLEGRYVFADFCEGELRSFDPRPGKRGKQEKRLGLKVPAPVSFGEDNEGRIYVVSLTGPVYRLGPA